MRFLERRRRGRAFAKLNLGLVVGRRGVDGYHPIRSLSQTVSWADELAVGPAAEDGLEVSGDAPADESNLAWQALVALRRHTGAAAPASLELRKSIPTAAGLGGGSADAAAVLGLSGLDSETLSSLAQLLAADVPFALVGGSAIVEGRGEQVTPVTALAGFAVAVVVPPVELETATVYAAWDRLNEPAGRPFPERALPPPLRDYVPLANDLTPAAASVEPAVLDWRDELETAWGLPAAMSGSGPSLFGFFASLDEAHSALKVVPAGARAAQAVEPVAAGWEAVEHEEG